MVKSSSVLFFRFNFVEFLDPSVDAVIDGVIKPLNHHSPCGTFFSYNFDS